MTAPPPGVDVKPLWSGRELTVFGGMGVAAGLVGVGLLHLVLNLVLPVDDRGPVGPFLGTDIAEVVQFALIGSSVAWLPGAIRSQRRMNAALFGTDDEVARLKYRVLRGKSLELTAPEAERGRHLARVTYRAIPPLLAFLLALAFAFSVSQFINGGPLSVALGVAMVAYGLGSAIFLTRRRRNALRFLRETDDAAS